MTKLLLTELFPNFVKKAQIQHLAKGPFGEGLLAKQGKRVYLKPGEQAPEGANVQTGPQGGQYYDEVGGGGGATEDPSAQGGYDIDYGDPERSAQVREDLDQEGIGVPPAPEPGPEISEDRNVVDGIDYGPVKPEIKPEDVDYGPAAATDEDGFPAGASPTGEERRAKREEAVANLGQQQADRPATYDIGSVPMTVGQETTPEQQQALDAQSQAAVDNLAGQVSTGDAEYDELASKFDGILERDERGYLQDVSEPVFSDGAMHAPGQDPVLISQVVHEGFEYADPVPLMRQYEAETGKTIDDKEFVENYTGPLNSEALVDALYDQDYGGQTYAQTLETPAEYELGSQGERISEQAGSLFDWIASKDTTGAASEPPPPSLNATPGEKNYMLENDNPFGMGSVARGELDWERSGFDQEDFHEAVIEAEGPYGSDSGMSADGAKTWMEENRIDPDSSLGAKLYDYADRYSRERAQESAWDYGGEYTLMEKMMQKYNVDNRRRDPIVRSNKGGRQR